ncbi:MAG TPA: rod shape-determining protein MreC, partial [Bryobacteraceae bacterium]|nr:rod shape-determining protein MreC [Bryobacteraceae bacterium]
GVLFAQVLGLAVQVKRTSDSEPTRLIRIWAVGTVTPVEKTLVGVQTSVRDVWHNYFYLRGVRAENRALKQEIERMRLEQVRVTQDADQARRLQALLAFKEQFISQTVAAQVIGSSGTEQSRAVYIDKGENAGVRPDMAVITADGIVGKVLHVFRSTSLVLLINDQTSGVGAILEKSRLQGILRGTPAGEIALEKVMSDESVPVGELVLTSGGDRIFPKGLPVGRISQVSPGNDLFLNIRVKPAISLSRLEEVLVVTKIDERQAEPDRSATARAADILAERLPSVPPKPENPPGSAAVPSSPGSAGKPAVDAKPKASPPSAAANGTGPAAPKTSTAAPTAGKPTIDTKPKASPPPAAGNGTAPAAPKTSTPATSAGKPTVDAKPNVSPPPTANGTVPSSQKAVGPAPSSARPVSKPAAGATGVKPSPKPAKPATEPKPQPPAQDAPQ